MRHLAISKGYYHPDLIADRIVSNIASTISTIDKDACCDLSCTIHGKNVFITGKIAYYKENDIFHPSVLEETIKDIISNAMMPDFYDLENSLEKEKKMKTSIHISCIKVKEKEELSTFDSFPSLIYGYAIKNKKANDLPVEKYLADLLMRNIDLKVIDFSYHLKEYQVLVDLLEDSNGYHFNQIIVDLPFPKKGVLTDYYESINKVIFNTLNNLPDDFKELRRIHIEKLQINLQEKEEVVYAESRRNTSQYYYGKEIPVGDNNLIGICYHQKEYCASLLARKLAKDLLKKYNYQEVIIKLGYLDHSSFPTFIEGIEKDEFGNEFLIPSDILPKSNQFSLDSFLKQFDPNFDFDNQPLVERISSIQ